MAAASRKIAQKADRELAERLPFGCHGSLRLPAVDVDSYNVELRERRRFVGDRANKRAFMALVERWRRLIEQHGEKPFPGKANQKLSRKDVEKALLDGDAEAAGVVQAALDDFARQLVQVIERYRKLPEWKKVTVIFIGGGMRGSRLGEMAIGRAQAMLYERKIPVDLRPIEADPDEAGLLGAVLLVPPWILEGHEGLLAVDIGGSNIRAGAIKLRRSKKRDAITASVEKSTLWEHARDEADREEAVERLLAMLEKLVRWSRKHKLRLAPFVGIGCPGRVRIDGAIDRGTQNLPGNWETDRFNLPQCIAGALTIVPGQRTVAVMHNDAVMQGLSELPGLRDAEHWAILTIGTGLGNAKFTMRR